jgi:FMN phosphatase YigB (HAD superfamily)
MMTNIDISYPEIDLSGVKAVFIDLDDTLYQYEPCHQHALTICADSACSQWRSVSSRDFKTAYREQRTLVTNRLQCGSSARSRLLAFQGVFEQLNIPQAYVHANHFDRLYWESFIAGMNPAPSALRFLIDCEKQGLPVCLVSDMQMSIQVEKLVALGMNGLIHYMVTSEEVGIEKPAPAMFMAALEKTGQRPADVIMLGDSESKDCEGARAVGIRAYRVGGTA